MKNLLPLAWIFLERLTVEDAAILFLAALDAVGSPCTPLLEKEWSVPTSASVTLSGCRAVNYCLCEEAVTARLVLRRLELTDAILNFRHDVIF